MAQQSVQTPRRTVSARPAARRKTRLGLPVPDTSGFPWRVVSGALVIAIGVIGYLVFNRPVFYVTTAEIGGLKYTSAQEIYDNAAVSGLHILWIDPDEVAERVILAPNIETAQVAVEWPARVVILVREREPAIVWEQGGTQYWVDVRGYLMVYRRDIPSLVRVINEGDTIPFRCPGPACPEEGEVSIDSDVILGSQYLKTLRETITVLYYDPARGLSFDDDRGWRAYFGVGTDMDLKNVIYEQILADLFSRGLTPEYVDISNPEAPYYRVSTP
nr:FtsQ-type POTRA domain-containing protein [Anaerolineae bacterium]